MVELSIIIPTRNRPAQSAVVLATLVPQLRKQPPTSPAEIIVVDDASLPAEAAQLQAAVDRAQPAPIRLLRLEARGGSSRTRNIGAAQASGRILAFLDDDVRPAPDYVRGVIAEHARHPEALVINGDIRPWRDDVYSRFWWSRYRAVFHREGEEFHPVSGLSSGNVTLKRALLGRLQPLFDEALPAREDFGLYLRLKDLQITCFKSNRILVLNDCRASLPALLAQHAWYGRGEYWLRLQYGESRALTEEAAAHTAATEAARRRQFPLIETAVRLAFHVGYHLEAYGHQRDLRALLRVLAVGPFARMARKAASTRRSAAL